MGVSRRVQWASTSWAIRVKAFFICPPFSAVFVGRVIAREGLHEKGRTGRVARGEYLCEIRARTRLGFRVQANYTGYTIFQRRPTFPAIAAYFYRRAIKIIVSPKQTHLHRRRCRRRFRARSAGILVDLGPNVLGDHV